MACANRPATLLPCYPASPLSQGRTMACANHTLAVLHGATRWEPHFRAAACAAAPRDVTVATGLRRSDGGHGGQRDHFRAGKPARGEPSDTVSPAAAHAAAHAAAGPYRCSRPPAWAAAAEAEQVWHCRGKSANRLAMPPGSKASTSLRGLVSAQSGRECAASAACTAHSDAVLQGGWVFCSNAFSAGGSTCRPAASTRATLRDGALCGVSREELLRKCATPTAPFVAQRLETQTV